MHTKGTWIGGCSLDNKKGLYGRITTQDGKTVIANTPDNFSSISPVEHESNVALMAAAPELLEALKTLLFNAEHGNGYEAIQQGRAAARAAIAKATGNA